MDTLWLRAVRAEVCLMPSAGRGEAVSERARRPDALRSCAKIKLAAVGETNPGLRAVLGCQCGMALRCGNGCCVYSSFDYVAEGATRGIVRPVKPFLLRRHGNAQSDDHIQLAAPFNSIGFTHIQALTQSELSLLQQDLGHYRQDDVIIRERGQERAMADRIPHGPASDEYVWHG